MNSKINQLFSYNILFLQIIKHSFEYSNFLKLIEVQGQTDQQINQQDSRQNNNRQAGNQMGDVTSICCQNTTHLQEINITRDINSRTEKLSPQNYTYQPYHQPTQQIKTTIQQAAQSHFFKYSQLSLLLSDESQIWNQKNIISLVKRTKLYANSIQKTSIFDIISHNDTPKFSAYIKSLRQDNAISEQQQNTKQQDNQPIVHSNNTVKVFNGLFLIHFPGKQYYLGHLHENQPTNGIFVFKPGCYYVGDIRDLTAQGQGRYENKQNGYVYEGAWSKNLQHGKGKQFYQRNGDTFEGQFTYGSKFGQGIYKFSDGPVYEGNFYNGLSQGIGKLSINPKQWYKGQWKMGSMHGQGQYHYPNGDVYIGQFQSGLKSGHGRYIFSAGYEYNGQWMDGKMHGFGIIKQGYDEIEGEWIEGKKVK